MPAGTNADIAARIGKAATRPPRRPSSRSCCGVGQSAGQPFTLEQAAAFYNSETERYEQIAKAIKLEAD